MKKLKLINSLIEFIFKYSENDSEVLTKKEYVNYKLSKKMTIIKFDNSNKNREISLSIFSKNEKEFKISMVSGYAKGLYYHYSKNNQPSGVEYKSTSYDITIFNPDLELENDESLYLALLFDYI